MLHSDMNIKESLKNSSLTKGMYGSLKKKIKIDPLFACHKTFIDRSKGSENLVIVLAGYKPYLYEAVFGRLRRYLEESYDVCIISSGKYSEALVSLCEANNWSYLSTKENNVCLVQNVAISLFPKARYIFKLDEDIFVTKDFFRNLKRAYLHCEQEGEYRPGIMAPILPLNGFAHMLVLKKLGLVDKYTELFEKPLYAAGNDRMIESNPDVAEFFWGEGGYVPSVDALNELFSKDEIREVPCAVKFSIGAILFERSMWEKMGYFHFDKRNPGMGLDEYEVCEYCIQNSRPIMVSCNTVAGHFSFGPQNEAMRSYYEKHKERFLAD